jgi:hypothetical protein
MVLAAGTALQMELHRYRFGGAQLPVDVPIELGFTILAIHHWGTCLMPLARTIPDSTA